MNMNVTATGIFTKPIMDLHAALAACHALQSWIGVASADLGSPEAIAAAKNRLHIFELDEEPEREAPAARAARRPCIILDYGRQLECVRNATASAHTRNGGSVSVLFEQFYDKSNETYNELEQFFLFGNTLDAIRAELFTTASRIPTNCRMMRPPRRRIESFKDGFTFFDAELEFGWGNL